MKARVDALGRIVVPKPLRDALGLTAGSVVDVSRYGDGLHIVPGGRTARLVETEDGIVVAESKTVVTDEMVFDLIEAGRR
ncbi:MAG: AbrB/MazE/SpoVT family DNA-binding domain-containing protein [Acidimicrobiia bacterium]